MKARVEDAWLRTLYEGDRESYEVIIRIDTRKGTFTEGIYHNYDEAVGKVKTYRRSYAVVDENSLSQTKV